MRCTIRCISTLASPTRIWETSRRPGNTTNWQLQPRAPLPKIDTDTQFGTRSLEVFTESPDAKRFHHPSKQPHGFFASRDFHRFAVDTRELLLSHKTCDQPAAGFAGEGTALRQQRRKYRDVEDRLRAYI